MSCRVEEIIKYLEELAPLNLAETWDNCGLQVGGRDRKVKKILLSLDVTSAVVKEAIAGGADMIVAHHPLIFKTLSYIDVNEPTGAKVSALLNAGVTVYAAHTNLDKAAGGVNDALAEVFSLQQVEALWPQPDNLLKLVIFVPKSAAAAVKKAVGDVGGGLVGNYSHCSFSGEGIGNFLPMAGANPYTGRVGRLESVEEVRLETIVRTEKIGAAVEAMLGVHPYEEVAYDIYPLVNKDKSIGLGRLGRLKKPLALRDFIELCRRRLKVEPMVAGHCDQVEKVAVCGGSGAELTATAQEKGADVFVSGDLKYHQAWTARENNFCLIDCTHDATEKVVLPYLKSYLQSKLGNRVELSISRRSTSPWSRREA